MPHKFKRDFVAIDVETATPKRWSICQIGVVIVEDGEITQSINRFVKPPNNEYGNRNIGIHGITPDRTEYEPHFPQIWDEIYPLIKNQLIIAHKAAFDIDCLQQTLEFYDLEVPRLDYECTYELTGHKLEEACKAYDIELINHHDACADAIACATLYLKISECFKPDYSKVIPNKKPSFSFKGHENLSGEVLKPDLKNADPNSPFYNKGVVFTGVLNRIKREDAAKLLHKMGANINTSISKKTDFVIVGIDPGFKKMKQISQLQEDGYGILILYENELLDMISKI